MILSEHILSFSYVASHALDDILKHDLAVCSKGARRLKTQ